MKITFYNSIKYEKTTTLEVNAVWVMPEPDQIREDIERGEKPQDWTPMLTVEHGDGFMSIPPQLVIQIIE